MDFRDKPARKSRKEKIRKIILKIREIMNFQHNIIDVIEYIRMRWFVTFEEDGK